MDKVNLTIEFDNQEALMHFASWLCGQGEQYYWVWMECRESEESGDITAVAFDYHNTQVENDKKVYGKFMSDNVIRTECGRLDIEF